MIIVQTSENDSFASINEKCQNLYRNKLSIQFGIEKEQTEANEEKKENVVLTLLCSALSETAGNLSEKFANQQSVVLYIFNAILAKQMKK